MEETFKQTWWDKNLSQKFDEFKGWVGDFKSESKVFVRNYVKTKNYESIVDCGCGPATEFFGYKHDGYDINYLGVDSSTFIHNHITNNGVPAILSPIEKIELPDSSFDVSFSRHVMEHLPTFRFGLSELIRLANKEAINVWFIKPDSLEEKINYDGKENLFHNKYNRNDVETLLITNNKVASWRWEDVNDKEIALFIQVKF